MDEEKDNDVGKCSENSQCFADCGVPKFVAVLFGKKVGTLLNPPLSS